MSKLSLAIIVAAAFVFSGCTVHHYHHETSPHGKKMKMKMHGKKMKMKMKMHGKKMKKHGAACGQCSGHALPAGHPPVKGMKGHGAMPKGHGMKGHHKKGHGAMPKGHGMKGHHKKGHGALPKGHPPVGHHGGSSDSDIGNTVPTPFAKSGKHAGHAGHEDHHKGNLPTEIKTFHDAFASAWHKESDETRRSAACGKVAEWKKLAQAVKKLSGGVVFTAATKDLHKQTLAVATNCTRKNGDVQAALKTAHDALHMLFKVASQEAEVAAGAGKKSPGLHAF